MTSLLQKINELNERVDNITTQVCFIVSRGGSTLVNIDKILDAKRLRALGNNTQTSTRSIGMTAIFLLFVLENSAALYSIRRTFP